MNRLFGAVVLGLAVAALPVQAAYISVDTFESYTVGNFNAGGTTGEADQGGPWIGRDGVGPIAGSGLIAVQNDGTTKHLAFGWNNNGGQRAAFRPVTSIADGGVGTYYFQIRSLDATPDMSYGLSDQSTATNAAPSGFGDFEVQVALVDDGNTTNNQFKLVGRNGPTLVDLATGLVTNTWYDVWVAVDNATDTYDVYFSTNVGDPGTLGAPVGYDLAFRNGSATNNLVTFMTLDGTGAGNPLPDSGAHLDDIYYNPLAVPEPASLALFALGVVATLVRRR